MTAERLAEIFSAAKPGDNLKKMLAPHFEFGPALLEHLLLGAGLAGNVKRKDVDVEEVSGKLLEVVNGGNAFLKSREAKGYIVQGSNDTYTAVTYVNVQYRVGHLLADLGWVDLDLECSTIMLGQ